MKIIMWKYLYGVYPVIFFFFLLLDFFMVLYIMPQFDDFIIFKSISSVAKYQFLARLLIIILVFPKISIFLQIGFLLFPISSLANLFTNALVNDPLATGGLERTSAMTK